MKNPDIGYWDLIEWYINLIAEVNPAKNSEQVRKAVERKISLLQTEEPHYLRAVLQSDLSPSEKVGRFTAIRDGLEPGERYPHKYHMSLRAERWILQDKKALEV